MTLAAIVLCGGASSRMGTPKAWLPIEGEPMLLRILRVMEDCSPRVVVAAPDQPLPELPEGVIVARDAERGRGPMEGLAAGLRCVSGLVYVSSCDAPFLTKRFIERMASLLGDEAIAVPEVEGRRHPLAAVYRSGGVLAVVEELLDRQRFRLMDLLARVPTRFVRAEELPGTESLRNVNTPEEYEAALRELSERRPSRPGRPWPGG